MTGVALVVASHSAGASFQSMNKAHDDGAGSLTQGEPLATLLTEVSQGDERAFKQIYVLTSAKLFGICLRICRDRGFAEDVLQAVYLKIWDRAGQFNATRAAPMTWLCTIARNTAIDWQRSAAGRSRLSEVSDDLKFVVKDDKPLADAVLEDQEITKRLYLCLSEIEQQKRDCIRAAFFDGFTYLQLAERENIPLGTMKSWMRRALLRLKDCLDSD